MTARGLSANAPRREGRAQDCYDVAVTALYLRNAVGPEFVAKHEGREYAPARHAVELVRISGELNRLGVRQCNEDVTCPKCGGAGLYGKDCRRCAGSGLTIGPRRAKLEGYAVEIATHYGLRCYFQTDPRGCALYLIDPASVPQSWAAIPGDPLERYVYGDEAKNPPTLAKLQERWIDANYTQGHAVTRLGR